jgi:hypothetical protein
MDPGFHKTPPKSAERIRAALESVQENVGKENEPGPYRDGLTPEARLVIASFHDPEGCRRFQQALLQAGIMSQANIQRTVSEVIVDYSDHDRASELLIRHLEAFPDRPPRTFRRDFDCTIFGIVIGGAFGLIYLAGELREPKDLVVALIFTLLGAITGGLLDRPRNRYRRTGQLQFGLGDVMVLMAVIALGITLRYLLMGRGP